MNELCRSIKLFDKRVAPFSIFRPNTIQELINERKFAQYLLSNKRTNTIKCDIRSTTEIEVSGYCSHENAEIDILMNDEVDERIAVGVGAFKKLIKVSKYALWTATLVHQNCFLVGDVGVLPYLRDTFDITILADGIVITFFDRSTEECAFSVVQTLENGFLHLFTSKFVLTDVKKLKLIFDTPPMEGIYELRYHLQRNTTTFQRYVWGSPITVETPYVKSVSFVVNQKQTTH
ncbi:hypothetical protein EIN_390620 [Entamoeba invadens IP1]|uniref:Uncharacterized protein n=1 Tax=Entamoeba invadens IP1 TaxID=370355 RepID=A0A0A1U5D1_ENTIV|nr:hypothetical protein EIN_390620 [Entamoeba invadens IP1]ELP89437.1 hypothetical protein EIN_390620 [Entamoeba invadens IP1]|eukprot:XP_004256208.1 hypothetical protein EIN_390620 [Entamoeba invadens IP1]